MVKRQKKIIHPTLFVLEGSIKHFEDGSMLELHSKVTAEEWELITEETVKYKVFLDKLKDVALPILEEQWDKEDEYFRLQMEVAVSRIRNIDALLVAKHNITTIGDEYEKMMRKNAKEVLELIEKVRKENRELLHSKYGADFNIPDEGDNINISSL